MRKPFARLLSLLLVLFLLSGMAAMPAAAERPLSAALCAPEKAFANPTSVKLNCYANTMLPGTILQLRAKVLPDGSDGGEAASPAVTWKSSRKSVAKVSSTGLVTAVRKGKATITAATTNITGKKQTAKCVITVNYDLTGVKYRFFGIANSDYDNDANDMIASHNDLVIMCRSYANALFGGAACKLYTRENCTGIEIRGLMDGMSTNYYGITENDVTVFYYSGHGVGRDVHASMRGALCGTDIGYTSSAAVSVHEVQAYLERVPGIVIVILDSCLSGQHIRQKGVQTAAAAPTQADIDAFNNEWVTALSGSKARNFNPHSKALADSPYKSKFKVLASSAALQYSYSGYQRFEGGKAPFSFFTKAFWQGTIRGGTSSKMKADRNRDQVVSLKEIHGYCRSVVRRHLGSRQSVKVWPSNDHFPVLAYLT